MNTYSIRYTILLLYTTIVLGQVCSKCNIEMVIPDNTIHELYSITCDPDSLEPLPVLENFAIIGNDSALIYAGVYKYNIAVGPDKGLNLISQNISQPANYISDWGITNHDIGDTISLRVACDNANGCTIRYYASFSCKYTMGPSWWASSWNPSCSDSCTTSRNTYCMNGYMSPTVGCDTNTMPDTISPCIDLPCVPSLSFKWVDITSKDVLCNEQCMKNTTWQCQLSTHPNIPILNWYCDSLMAPSPPQYTSCGLCDSAHRLIDSRPWQQCNITSCMQYRTIYWESSEGYKLNIAPLLGTRVCDAPAVCIADAYCLCNSPSGVQTKLIHGLCTDSQCDSVCSTTGSTCLQLKYPTANNGEDGQRVHIIIIVCIVIASIAAACVAIGLILCNYYRKKRKQIADDEGENDYQLL